MDFEEDGEGVPSLERGGAGICDAGGTTTPFWWGSSISTSQANYDGNFTYGTGLKGEYRRRFKSEVQQGSIDGMAE